MDCIRCETPLTRSSQLSIHDECLRVWQNLHEQILFDVFPKIFPGKSLHHAQGLAVECLQCYRLAVPNDVWKLLPQHLKTSIRTYDVADRQLICRQCRGGKNFSTSSERKSKIQNYRRNADTSLRQAELQFQKEPTREHWSRWLREAARAGAYPFTAEGVAAATGGAVTDFQITEDGFRAKLTLAEHPAIEAIFQIGPEDWDSFPRGQYDAEIWVQWDKWDDDPSLYIDIDEIREEIMQSNFDTHLMVIPGGEYHYIGASVQNDEQLMIACRNPKEWESI